MLRLKYKLIHQAFIISLSSCLWLSACDTKALSDASAAQKTQGSDAFNLGMQYFTGDGDYVQQDYDKAMTFFKAAHQGNAEAQNFIGVMYHQGNGVEIDNVKAVEWFQKAAEQGNASAQNNIG